LNEATVALSYLQHTVSRNCWCGVDEARSICFVSPGILDANAACRVLLELYLATSGPIPMLMSVTGPRPEVDSMDGMVLGDVPLSNFKRPLSDAINELEKRREWIRKKMIQIRLFFITKKVVAHTTPLRLVSRPVSIVHMISLSTSLLVLSDILRL